MYVPPKLTLPVAPEISKVPFVVFTAEEFSIDAESINNNVAPLVILVEPPYVLAELKDTKPPLIFKFPVPDITPLIVYVFPDEASIELVVLDESMTSRDVLIVSVTSNLPPDKVMSPDELPRLLSAEI